MREAYDRDGIVIVRLVSHSARVVHSTSYSDVTSRGRPALGPYESFPDVLIRRGRGKDVA